MDEAVLFRMGLRRVGSIGRKSLYLTTGLDRAGPESCALACSPEARSPVRGCNETRP